MLTGRQHQIRAHLSLLGCPVVGDKIYGEDETLFLEYLESGLTPGLVETLILPRHALHAHRVEFVHPFTGEAVRVTSPIPYDMKSLASWAGQEDIFNVKE